MTEESKIFQREKQSVTACQLLQVLAQGEAISLSQCYITGPMDINRLFDEDEDFDCEKLQVTQAGDMKILRFDQPLVFDKCVFEENAVFSGPWTEPDSVAVQFGADVIFNSSNFKGQARFRNSVFNGTAGFDGCSFSGVTTFKNGTFKKDAKFRTVTFTGYALFGSATFDSTARFTNTHFVKGINLSQVRFNSDTDFSGVYSSSRTVPSFEAIHFARRRSGDDESFWRFVKQSALEAGYYQLAGECFYKERCSNLWSDIRGPGYAATLGFAEKLKRWFLAIRLLPEFVFGKMLFGYGERPARVLLASAIVVLVCAFYYAQPGVLLFQGQETEATFFKGLYFSTTTFTTLGSGDFYPNPTGFGRTVVMIETIAGAYMIALFVIALAKKYSRG